MGSSLFQIEKSKLENVLQIIERMAGGDTSARFNLSAERDSLDAICYGINVLVQELTYSKDEAEKANKIKSDFLATISHEIRTPVTAIKGFSELVSTTHLSEQEQAAAIGRIISNSSTLLALIDDLLDLSKIEANKLPTEKNMVSPIELVSEVIDGARAAARVKGLGLNVEFSKDLPEFVETDALRLKQILANVISNAIKYTDNGKIDIWVDLSEIRESNNKHLSVVVEDTGKGISPQLQAALFQPYTRAEGVLSRGPAGAGLGLALSKRLAQLLGGDLKVMESSTGVGSAFKITVDAGNLLETVAKSVIESSPQETNKQRFTVEKTALKDLKILLAEDNEDLQALFKSLFEMAGASVEVAENGERAIELATKGTFDIVLMDVTMPKLSGLDATKALRSFGYKTPILALSAHAMKEHQAECLRAGYTGFVPKPVDIKTLFVKILSTLRH